MNTPTYYEPDHPLPLPVPWLRVRVDGEDYAPCLIRIRKREFDARLIASLDVKRHGHSHPIYHLIYFLEGTNTLLVDNREVGVRAGQMVVIDPDVYHNVVPREPRDCAFLTLMFTYEGSGRTLSLPFPRLLGHLTGLPAGSEPVVDDPRGTFLPYFTCLDREVLGRQEKDPRLIGACIAGLLNELTLRDLHNSPSPYIPEDILAVQQYLLSHLDQSVTIEDLTRVSHLSRSHLIGKFKQYFGQSPIDYLIHERIEKAKTYLLHSSKRVKEIAWLCGFQSEYYFSKTFKKRTRTTPGAFRKLGAGSEYAS